MSEIRSLVDDEARIERDHYEQLLREYGIDPWRIPEGEEEPS
jgi:DNA-directed RNA polymerase subunit H (RpoH/RPB5)